MVEKWACNIFLAKFVINFFLDGEQAMSSFYFYINSYDIFIAVFIAFFYFYINSYDLYSSLKLKIYFKFLTREMFYFSLKHFFF